MTDIEKKALALVNEVCAEWEVVLATDDDMDGLACFAALTRAIEQHEAYKREVSDAVEALKKVWGGGWHQCSEAQMCDRFIIPKTDPLVEAWQMAFPGNHIDDARDECAKIIAAIEARGGRIVWEGE